jgi:hypothetical protein
MNRPLYFANIYDQSTNQTMAIGSTDHLRLMLCNMIHTFGFKKPGSLEINDIDNKTLIQIAKLDRICFWQLDTAVNSWKPGDSQDEDL